MGAEQSSTSVFEAMMQKALAQGDAYPDGGGGGGGGGLSSGGMGGGDPMAGAFAPDNQPLVECAQCGRRMTAKALQSHAKVIFLPYSPYLSFPKIQSMRLPY